MGVLNFNTLTGHTMYGYMHGLFVVVANSVVAPYHMT